ncbi:MAG TPA: methylated-DNA--[protein]-cysteine S-methyltransferase [Longimicrobium sp.]|jgi:methylated-DNA-[protein]-cysteine S-methyltransferase
MTAYAARVASPIGTLTAVVDEAGALTRLLFAGDAPPPDAVWDEERCAPVAAELGEYFRGERRDFGVPLAPRGTDFQRRVWDELRRIPYGQTISYRELAARVGRPAAVRAVGRANGTNPIPIIVPCHRVIGTDGSLTGYGGGLETKRRLLELEGAAV